MGWRRVPGGDGCGAPPPPFTLWCPQSSLLPSFLALSGGGLPRDGKVPGALHTACVDMVAAGTSVTLAVEGGTEPVKHCGMCSTHHPLSHFKFDEKKGRWQCHCEHGMQVHRQRQRDYRAAKKQKK